MQPITCFVNNQSIIYKTRDHVILPENDSYLKERAICADTKCLFQAAFQKSLY